MYCLKSVLLKYLHASVALCDEKTTVNEPLRVTVPKGASSVKKLIFLLCQVLATLFCLFSISLASLPAFASARSDAASSSVYSPYYGDDWHNLVFDPAQHA